jgi:glycerol uptake facilitator-like aquaporin
LHSTLSAKLLAELLGTFGIVATVIGAAHMASDLGSSPDAGLVINAIATGAVLFTLISIFASISGAHFNPSVTFVMLLRKEITPTIASLYMVAQLAGAAAGAVLANLMFSKPVVGPSSNLRDGLSLYLGEAIATFGLVLVILLLIEQSKTNLIPAAVALWIVAGYFFTSSTSFANPAVTFGRAFSDAGSSIAWESVLGFVVVQLVAAVIAFYFSKIFTKQVRRDQ